MYENSATLSGNGLFINSGNADVDNNIFDGSILNVTVAPGASLNDIGYNMVGNLDNMFNKTNHDVFTASPDLANALAQNGAPAGYQPTLALATTSLGYLAGDPNLYFAGDIRDTDERGFSRQDAFISIGAEDPDAVPLGGGGGGVGWNGTSTAVASSANPGPVGQPITLTAVVRAAYGAAGTPTGTVTFMVW